MGKSLKPLFFIALVLCSSFSLVSQSSNKLSENQNSVISEDSIILGDETATENQNSVQNQNSSYKSVSGAGVFVRMIVVLLIVVLLIYAFFWFVKRKGNVQKTDDDYLRRVAYLNVAPGKTVEVITLIDKAYLIGVTEENITLLGEITDSELISAMNINADKKANVKKPATFNEVLDLFLQKGGKKKSVFSQEEIKVENLFSETSSFEDENKGTSERIVLNRQNENDDLAENMNQNGAYSKLSGESENSVSTSDSRRNEL